MKPNRTANAPVADARTLSPEDRTRNEKIGNDRARAKELMATATTPEEVRIALHQASVEIAKSELGEDGRDFGAARSADERAHHATMELLSKEVGDPERIRLADVDARAKRDQASKNADIDFVANEMKLQKAARYLAGGG